MRIGEEISPNREYSDCFFNAVNKKGAAFHSDTAPLRMTEVGLFFFDAKQFHLEDEGRIRLDLTAGLT